MNARKAGSRIDCVEGIRKQTMPFKVQTFLELSEPKRQCETAAICSLNSVALNDF